MKTRPMLFSDAMVRAILYGRKTQTRRVIKQPIPTNVRGFERYINPLGNVAFGWVLGDSKKYGTLLELANMRCPYGQPGDRIWVRECHYVIGETNEVFYRASGGLSQYAERDRLQNNPPLIWQGPWRPSIFMKRAWSRIALEITNVRVERLQDISNADAIAEGIERNPEYPALWKSGNLHGDQNTMKSTGFPKLAYRSIWEQINGHESWVANPWVWVIEFKRVDNSQ